MAHDTTCWAPQHPELGYPPDYEAAVIRTQTVSMNNSRLVFGGGTLVHGGGYNGVGDDTFPGSRYVEQLSCKPAHPTAHTALTEPANEPVKRLTDIEKPGSGTGNAVPARPVPRRGHGDCLI
jgi:hypothetical protein